MGNKILIGQTNLISDTYNTVNDVNIGDLIYYQVNVEDIYGYQSSSNIESGFRHPGVTLFGSEGKYVEQTADGG